MQAILFAILTFIGWGSGDIFGAIASRKIGALRTMYFVMIATGILFLPFILSHIHELSRFTPVMAASLIGLSILFVTGNISVNEALRLTNPALAVTILSSYSALIVVLSVLFYQEPITTTQIIIIAIIYFGIWLCVYTPAYEIKSKGQKGAWYAVYAMFAFGFFFTLLKPIIAVVGWFWPIYLTSIWLPIVAWLVKKQKNSVSIPVRYWLPSVIMAALLLRGGDLFFNMAIDQGNIAIVAPISGISPVLSTILAFFVFREPISKRQLFGILLALTGVVALGFVV